MKKYTGERFGKLTINDRGNELIIQYIIAGDTEQQAKIKVCGKDAIQLALWKRPPLSDISPSKDELLAHLQSYFPEKTTIDFVPGGITLDGVVFSWPDEMDTSSMAALLLDKEG